MGRHRQRGVRPAATTRSCDTTSNINVTALDRNTDAHRSHGVALRRRRTTAPTPPTGGNLLGNPGFESGATVWTGTSGAITSSSVQAGPDRAWKAWLGGNGRTTTEDVAQSVTIPAAATSATLTFWLRIDTAETTDSTVYDTAHRAGGAGWHHDHAGDVLEPRQGARRTFSAR